MVVVDAVVQMAVGYERLDLLFNRVGLASERVDVDAVLRQVVAEARDVLHDLFLDAAKAAVGRIPSSAASSGRPTISRFLRNSLCASGWAARVREVGVDDVADVELDLVFVLDHVDASTCLLPLNSLMAAKMRT